MCQIVGDEVRTVFGLGFYHLFSTTTPQGPRFCCQSPRAVAEFHLSITSASPQHVFLHGSSLPDPCAVTGPFPRTRGAWVSLPVTLQNGRHPLPAPWHLLVIFHPSLTTWTWLHLSLASPTTICHLCLDTTYVKTPLRVCHSCLNT